MDFTGNIKDIIKESSNSFNRIKNNIKQIGPYHSYDMRLFEVLPSNQVDNKNNRIILDSFANLVCDGFWKPVFQGRAPLGLEVFADGDNTTFHILLPNDKMNMQFMINKIYACFNGSTINALKYRDDYMQRFNNRVSDIYKLDIRNHPFMPFSMDLVPIGNVLAEAMELLVPGEIACVQVLLQPTDIDWQSKCRLAYEKYLQTYKVPPFGTNPIRYFIYLIDAIIEFINSIFRRDDNYMPNNYNSPTIRDKFFHKQVTDKLTSTGFRAIIRISVQSLDRNKRSNISRSIASAFTQMNRYNEFGLKKFVRSDVALNAMKERKISFGSDFIITSEEARVLITLPDINARVTRLKKAIPNEELVDPSVSNGGIYIGDTLPYKNKTIPVGMASRSFNEINKTLLVMAAPGFGKSTMAERIAYECMKLGFGFLVADVADGTMAFRVLKTQEDSNNKKIAWLNFADKNNLPQLSPSIITGTPETRSLLFVEWFEQMLNLSDNAPRAKVYLKKFASSCFCADENNGIAEFKLLIDCDKDMVTKTMNSLKKKNPALYLWWLKQYSKEPDKIHDYLDPIRIRLDEILENSLLRAVFCNNKTNIDIPKWMDEGYGVIINLPENDNITLMHQQSIMSFIFLAFWSATKSRATLMNKGIKPRSFKLMLDEPYTYIHCTNTIEVAINKFRKYGVSLNIFLHGVDQIVASSKKLWDAIMDSQPNLILGDISEKSLKALRNNFLMLSDVALNELFLKVKNRDDHNFVVNMSFDDGLVKPFVFHSADVLKEKNNKAAVIESSRKLYAPLTIDEVDTIYFAKSFKMSTDEYKRFVKGEESKGVSEWVDKGEEEVNEIQSGI